MSHASALHDADCHCARCRPLERPCDCEWCRDYRTKKAHRVVAKLQPFLPDPVELEVLHSCMDRQQTLVFVDRDGACQKCADCWFNWFDTGLCQDAPCNSQGRHDGRVGAWQEPGRKS